MDKRGWESVDVIIVSGDAYVDHPAFGSAVIGRLLEKEGLRVAILAQPNWRDDLRDFKKLGKPELFFGVTAGNMDSMVNHYTANRRLRSNDAYTPGGKAGFRPDYASIVYCQILKALYPDVPIVLGGIEASLRRVTHYDYWSDCLKPPILADSNADLLVYGMGELPLLEIVHLMKKGVPFRSLSTIPQTAFLQDLQSGLPKNRRWETFELTAHETCLKDKKQFARNFKYIEQESNKIHARRLVQAVGNQRLVINPPYPPMTEKQIDAAFDLPYTRLPHPRYQKRGPIPAFEMIKFSVNMHRGCFGGCSFCTISAHQGKFIASRSQDSILKEVDKITRMPDFKGYLSDLGGPSGNMYKMQGKDLSVCERCVAPSCIHPTVCQNLDTSHEAMLEIYRKVNDHPKIKKAIVSSGIRYDISLNQPEYIEQLVTHHVSGRLKVAPEHTDPGVLKQMRKPKFDTFYRFKDQFDSLCKKNGLNQQIIPYFISSHPGCGNREMADLAVKTKELGYKLEQIQDFTPTPMTVATVVYYSGYHPYSLKKVPVARTRSEKLSQRQFFFWYKSENRKQLEQKLRQMGREDLIERLYGKMKRTSGKRKIHEKRNTHIKQREES